MTPGPEPGSDGVLAAVGARRRWPFDVVHAPGSYEGHIVDLVMVQIEDPQVFLTYAEFCRGTVKTLLKGVGGPHVQVDPGPDGAFALINTVVNEHYDEWARFITDACRGVAGLGYVSEYIGVKFPETDQQNRFALSGLMYDAEAAAPPPPTERPDPRFVSAPRPL